MTTPTKAPPKPAETETLAPPETRKFTVDEYYRMAEAGILYPDERVELIEGEIIVMAPMGHLHIGTVNRWNRFFGEQARRRYTVQIQSAIRLGAHSQPEPDVAILRFREDDYLSGMASPADVFLVVEISDTTLDSDRQVKVLLYAQANIPETWLMNLVEDCIESFTGPGPEGYANHTIYRRGDRISPSTLPDVEFAVEDLLPPVVEAPENA